MSQGEVFRADALDEHALAGFAADPAVQRLRRGGFAPERRARIVALIAASGSAQPAATPDSTMPTSRQCTCSSRVMLTTARA